jgi:diaminohydroxyphosphoribosylaminopyrimidine deaminase/5-amino-6-(5-phosphoribosylamino)uracil reductase
MELVRSGISRVVAAMRDPDPRVNGGGFRSLRRHGVAVQVGLLNREAARLNESFTKFTRRRLPLVTLKGATSLDGRIATHTGDSKWITSAEAREHARLLRRENDLVMVGIGTVLADDPLLTARFPKFPVIRAVMDTHLRIPPRAKLVTTVNRGPVVVFTGPDSPRAREAELRRRGVEVRRVALLGAKPDLRQCLGYLADCGVTRVLVEGGGELHASFVEQRLADRLLLYVAPRLIGGREALPLVGGSGVSSMKDAGFFRRRRFYRVGEEIVVEVDLS